MSDDSVGYPTAIQTYNHCMVDLETLATRPGAVILTVGAVAFDPVAGIIGAEFYMRATPKSCAELGLRIDFDTLDWWIDQSAEAFMEAFRGERHSIQSVLHSFNRFYLENSCTRLWCHGAGFDEPIISTALRGMKTDAAWNFRDVRDTRTIYELADVKLADHVGSGTKHNALHDAKAQASAVIAAYRKLRPIAALRTPFDEVTFLANGIPSSSPMKDNIYIEGQL